VGERRAVLDQPPEHPSSRSCSQRSPTAYALIGRLSEVIRRSEAQNQSPGVQAGLVRRPPSPALVLEACGESVFRANVVVVNVSGRDAEVRRRYTMRARAQATEQTAERVMDAAISLWRAGPFEEITLKEIAERAGVSLSTVMRRFGSKDGLAEAVLSSDRVGTQAGRDAVAESDVSGAVEMIVADYELNGDAVIRMLALEERIDVIRHVVEAGRVAHERWVERVFGPLLAAGSRHRMQVLQLVAATDVSTWKLLRRDRHLSPDEVVAVMEDLCRRVAGDPSGREADKDEQIPVRAVGGRWERPATAGDRPAAAGPGPSGPRAGRSVPGG
jgi:AcrR family transcriptional regulator